MANTSQQYDNVVKKAKNIYMAKMQDYGTSWRIMRLPSLTDQIFIKAKQIRSFQETGVSRVGDTAEEAFTAMLNYGIMALMQCELGTDTMDDIPADRAEELYDKYIKETKDLMMGKNHDYGEAWRDMRVSSMTDIILQKIRRLKQIEDHNGKTTVSEGVQGSYSDIINYSIFCLIQLSEGNK